MSNGGHDERGQRDAREPGGRGVRRIRARPGDRRAHDDRAADERERRPAGERERCDPRQVEREVGAHVRADAPQPDERGDRSRPQSRRRSVGHRAPVHAGERDGEHRHRDDPGEHGPGIGKGKGGEVHGPASGWLQGDCRIARSIPDAQRDTMHDDTADLADRIGAAFPELARAGSRTLENVASRAVLHKVPAGTQLFSEHQPCSGFPLVLSG